MKFLILLVCSMLETMVISLPQAVPTTKKPCVTGCYKPRIEEDTDMYYQRLELIKRDILDQLGLDEPPKITNQNRNIPKVVLDGVPDYRYAHDGSQPEEKLKTIILPAEIVPQSACFNDDDKDFKASCIKFKFSSPSSYKTNIENLNLWLHLSKITKGKKSSIIFYDNNPNQATSKILLKSRIRTTHSGWVGITIRDKRKWLFSKHGNLDVNLSLKVKCINCEIDYHNNTKPYLDITEKMRIKRRRRRHTYCQKDSSACCLDNFYVSFKTIGWDNWIRNPVGFNAQQCRGRCDSHHPKSNPHRSMVSAIAARRNVTGDIKFCCTTQAYAPLKISFQDFEGNVVHQTLTNMIATECGCG